MLPDQVQALLLSGLLSAPLMRLLWRGLRERGTVESEIDAKKVSAESLAAPWTVVKWFSVVVFLATAWLVLALTRQPLPLLQRLEALTLLVGAMTCLVLAPVYPMAGPIAYLGLSYTFP